MGRANQVAGQGQLFGHFFAGAQADEFNLDIAIGVLGVAHRVACAFDDLTCQLFDVNGFAHIQNKNLATLGHRTRPQHQMHGLLGGHEITRYLGVGHRHRATTAQLFLKQRHDRTG